MAIESLPFIYGNRTIYHVPNMATPSGKYKCPDVSYAIWHRENGPAVIYENGSLEWWYENNSIEGTADYYRLCGYDDVAILHYVLKYGNMLPSLYEEYMGERREM